MLLGQARGKVGSLVFTRVNGKQVTRSRAEVVKNPKTTNQIMQRVILNTVAQSYSLMQPIVDHSYEGIQAGQKTMSKYMSENLKALRERVANAVQSGADLYELYNFTPVGVSKFSLNEFIVAKGNLPESAPYFDAEDASNNCRFAVAANTYEAVIEALGAQRGDQMTIMFVGKKGNGYVFAYNRIILDPVADGQPAELSTAFVTGNAITDANSRNEGAFVLAQFSTDHIKFSPWGVGADAPVMVAAAIILSRKENGTWKRSNATLVLGDTAGQVSFGQAVDQSSADFSAESDRYLNNAEYGSNVNFNGSNVSPIPRMVGVVVNGTDIAASGTTNIAANAASTIVISGNTAAVEGALRASYKIGSGAWAAPIALNASGKATFSGVNLSAGVVHFALGTGTTASNFNPTHSWGGTAVIQAPAITGVTVNGVSIASSGTTDVVESASSTIRIDTLNCDGKTAAYKIGSGAWSTPVAVSGNAAQFAGVNLAHGNNVTFAVGTGATAGAFSPELNYGGAAAIIETPPVSMTNVTYGGSPWTQNRSIDQLSTSDHVTGGWQGVGNIVGLKSGSVQVGDVFASMGGSGIVSSGYVTNQAFDFAIGSTYSEVTTYYLFAVREADDEFIVTYVYPYTITVDGI